MAIKIVRPNYSIEVATEEELRIVLKAMDSHQLAMPLSPNPTQPDQNNGLDPFVAFWGNLRSEKARVMVQALAQAKEGLTDSELRQRLGLSKNVELAGVIRGVGFAAQRSGLPLSRIWQMEKTGKGSTKTLTYKLRGNALKGILDAQQPGQKQQNTPSVAGS